VPFRVRNAPRFASGFFFQNRREHFRNTWAAPRNDHRHRNNRGRSSCFPSRRILRIFFSAGPGVIRALFRRGLNIISFFIRVFRIRHRGRGQGRNGKFFKGIEGIAHIKSMFLRLNWVGAAARLQSPRQPLVKNLFCFPRLSVSDSILSSCDSPGPWWCSKSCLAFISPQTLENVSPANRRFPASFFNACQNFEIEREALS